MSTLPWKTKNRGNLRSGDCAIAATSPVCSLTNIQSDQSSQVTFLPIDYAVSASVLGGHGTVECSPPTVRFDGSSVCTAAPEAGYQVSGWTGDCALAGTNVQCALDYIESDKSSTVSFSAIPPNTYTVTAKAKGGGAVSCSPTSVLAGGDSICTATPKAGYQVSGWSRDCASAGTSPVCA